VDDLERVQLKIHVAYTHSDWGTTLICQ
jgi:hypothetical protein